VIGGHDKHRIASKIGQPQARVLAMLLLTLKGTPFFYMGDEFGAERVAIPPERVCDPFEKLVGGFGLGRDPERAPMRWDGSDRGGFTSGTPWLPLGDSARNVDQQRRDGLSLLHLYRELIRLRRRYTCLSHGEYRPLRSRNDILAYERFDAGSRMLIVLNLAREPRLWPRPCKGTRLLSTSLEKAGGKVDGPILLRANEGLIVATDAS
jgi:alpha-glucosidase